MTTSNESAVKPDLKITNLRTFRGNEGEGFSAVLWVDGVKTADVYDDANGGQYMYEVLAPLDKPKLRDDLKARLQRALDWAGTIPSERPSWAPADWVSTLSPAAHAACQLDMTISGLVDDLAAEKKIKAWCKKWIVYRLKGDEPGSYGTIKPPRGTVLTPAYLSGAVAHLQKKYGDKLDRIYNLPATS
jgi:hypothetical protein